MSTTPASADSIDQLSESNPNPNPVARQLANFHTDLWGTRFLDYAPDAAHSKVVEEDKELAQRLKEKVLEKLLHMGDRPMLDQLCFIDSIERIGVAYHFEKEIEDVLRRIHETAMIVSNDLFLSSLRFRLLRQHGFNVSCEAFERFMSSSGSMKEVVAASDLQGVLSLYEACHVRVHGEHVLDEAHAITLSTLKSAQIRLNHPLKEKVEHALGMALWKRSFCLDCLHYMRVYEKDPFHDETLLHFAKLNFNLFQLSRKKELSDLCRWWKSIDLKSKLPLRDRIVEAYFWASLIYAEPQYSKGRKIATMICHIMTSLDDIYDAYGTLEELEILTEAVVRWDKSCLDQLPEYMKPYYQALILDAFDEMECDLAAKGRSKYVYHAREEIKALCQSYMAEARWRHKGYVPTFDEYLELAIRNSAIVETTVTAFLDMDAATDADFEWIRKTPKPVKAACLLLRFLDDIGGEKFDQNRDHSSLAIDCYMRQYGVSHEEACKELYKRSNELWKDLNEAMIPPLEIPLSLFKALLNVARSIEAIYDGGEDGFTSVNKGIKENIRSLFVDAIPI